MKAAYSCLLAIVPLGARGRKMIWQAQRLANLHNAKLVVATMVDFDTGCETDHYPFKTPQEIIAAMVQHAQRTLHVMIGHTAGDDLQCVAVAGRGRKAPIWIFGHRLGSRPAHSGQPSLSPASQFHMAAFFHPFSPAFRRSRLPLSGAVAVEQSAHV